MNINKNIDVVGVGNAIVDIILSVQDSFLKLHGLEKGSMFLADHKKTEEILKSMNPVMQTAGGSAANTIFGLSQLGCKGAFIGKRSDDDIGDFFSSDLEASNIYFKTEPMLKKDPSGRCLILVTPDAERTMVTFLGSSKYLSTEDIDENIIKDSKIIYLEGYLFDLSEAQQAFKQAAKSAHLLESIVAFSLSDSFCVDRHREEMKKFILNDVNILLCNEAEILSLYQLDSVQKCTSALRREVDIAVITMGGKGAKIVNKNDVYEISAFSTSVVDTTGAGDFFAAGFLAGLSKNFSLKNAGVLGSACSAEIISHYGARPEISLEKFIKRFDFNNNM